MRRANTRERKLRLGRATLCAALVAVCAVAALAQPSAVAPAAADAQKEQPRVVVEVAQLAARQHPVELVGVEVGGEAHPFAEAQPGQFLASFDARDGWLGQFAFKIRNRSDKAITLVAFNGYVGTGEKGDIPLGINALYGREPDESAYTGITPRGEPRRLAPGETAEVRLSADEYDRIVRHVTTKKRSLADYRKVRVDVRDAYFEDGTVWSMGRVYRIDPNDSRKWTALDGRPLPGASALRALGAGERIVEADSRRITLEDEPGVLAVTEIRIGGRTVVPGQPFVADADWMRGLTLRVKNLSAKPITFIQISFSLPEATYHAGGLGFIFRFGESRLDGQTTPGAKQLPPGEEADVSFSEGEYQSSWKFTTGRSGLSEFSHVRVGSASVAFADGTWASVTNLLGKKPAAAAGAK